MSRDSSQTGLEPAARAEDFSSRHLVSFTVGVNLVVNAIRDAYLVVDGPDCVYMRSQYIQGNHDYLSTLTSVSGHHRVVNTALEPAHVMHGREQALVDLLVNIGQADEAACVLLSSMPMAAILGIDYGRLCRRAARTTGKPVIHVPGKSLSTDWLGGYAEGLQALAQAVPLADRDRPDHRVAVVGLLYDRNEGDCSGDVSELNRLLEAMGLEVVSVWLDGRGAADLAEVSGAGTILSLPYGRQAARTLARRLDAQMVETELPFGLQATEAWLRQVAQATNRLEQAERLIDTELTRVVPRLEWVAPTQIEGRRFGYAGDPHLLSGFHEIIQTFGGQLDFAVITNCAHHLEVAPPLAPTRFANGTRGTTDSPRSSDLDSSVHIAPTQVPLAASDLLVEPRHEALLAFLDSRLQTGRLDCLVTNSICVDSAVPSAHAVVEFGFPSYNVHALHDRPRLGFNGVLAFVDTVANACRLHTALSEVPAMATMDEPPGASTDEG